MSLPFPEQMRSLPEQFTAPPRAEGGGLAGTGRLWIAGLGGSAMAGEFLALGLGNRCETRVVREDALPAAAGPGDRLLCLSYSGRTVETLAVWDDAAERGIARAAVAGGGPLLERARAEGAPAAAVPSGFAPRSALGHLLRAAALLVPGADLPWGEAAKHLDRIRARWGGPGGAAEPLSEALAGRLPALLVSGAGPAAAARRWAADLSENAKAPSVVWELPEAAHNAVMTLAREAGKPVPLRLVALGEPRGGAARVRWDATLAVLADHGAASLAVRESHPDPWVEALGLAYAGDWTSLRLAERVHADPASLSLMDDLKRRLAAGAGGETPTP